MVFYYSSPNGISQRLNLVLYLYLFSKNNKIKLSNLRGKRQKIEQNVIKENIQLADTYIKKII